MKKLITLAALAAITLTACGTEQPEAASTQQGTTAPEPTETTEATTTTVEPEDNLEDAVEACAEDTIAATDAAEAMYDAEDVGPSYGRNITEQVAEEQGMTADEWVATLWAEVFTLDSDGSITIGGAWEGYDTDEDERYWDMTTPIGEYMGYAWECLATTIDVPARVENHMSTTRAMDGTQEDSWDDYEARWTYHPDNGFTVTVWEVD